MKAFLILCFLLPVTWAAHKGGDCPVPCCCYEFLGVQSAYCNGTGVKSVPRGIPNNTQLLDLSDNPIPFIKVGDIEQLPNLEYIVLNSNGYHEGSIEPGALDLPKLTTIDLGYNLYMSIPISLPKKMTALMMPNNPITTLKANSFLGYPYLQDIEFYNNGLRVIEEGTFHSLQDLQYVRITFNNLTDEGALPNMFENNINLTDISLSCMTKSYIHMLSDNTKSVLALDCTNKNQNNSSKRKREDECLADGYSPKIKKTKASLSHECTKKEENDKKHSGQTKVWDQRQVLPEECHILAKFIGIYWQVFGIELGLKNADIEQIEDDTGKTLIKIKDMLCRWINVTGNPKVCDFIAVMESCNCKCVTFEKEDIYTYFEKPKNC